MPSRGNGLPFFYALVFAFLCCSAARAETPPPQGATATAAAEALIRVLRRAYPDFADRFHSRAASDANGHYLLSREGGQERIPLLAARVKSPSRDIKFPVVTLADTLEQTYPAGAGGRWPAEGFDPGRARCIPLLQALYGDSAEAVRANCDAVDFLGQRAPFNRRFGAADALRRVAARLTQHLAAHPQDRAYVLPLAGTFVWRPVKDTGRLSAHAFGIAIDLNAEKGLYRLWKPSPERLEATRQAYPQAVVDAFEAEGFIWGGKWSAFDFMHFEYRPELLSPKAASR